MKNNVIHISVLNLEMQLEMGESEQELRSVK